MPRSTAPPDWVLARRRRLGARLRAARTEANLTQQEVGLRTGIDRSQVGKIEMGKDAALIDTLILMADAIGVPLSELVRE
ncbi:helix-turn-helix domain-containing protein [Streptomyces erythrochromogenes]|uniref:helix-turn-helix domain-containing protein n=1 Tax=Streptomyces erythrochromogenes TaxID=285574 RepID=UPI0022563AD6|nr:helix-turn-helix transcriptional regulator [Streptomyces erythrochromogenes]MCX5587526.1 helix-turn-helix transcriptional regulator [Streptomyces erythrochromogenes]